jgi:hypothetical protein
MEMPMPEPHRAMPALGGVVGHYIRQTIPVIRIINAVVAVGAEVGNFMPSSMSHSRNWRFISTAA